MRKFVMLPFIGILMALTFSASASAYCGPGFSSKRSATKYYEGIGRRFLPSMHSVLVKRGVVRRDEAMLSFLKSDRVVNVRTPRGYRLRWNTLCSGNQYQDFLGNLDHSGMNVLAVKFEGKPQKVGKPKVRVSASKVIDTREVQELQPDGSINVYRLTITETTKTTTQQYRQCTAYIPFMKGYCRNLVSGNKWKVCRRYSKKRSKKSTKTSRKLLRVIPASPKDGTRGPEAQPRTPETPPKDGTKGPGTGTPGQPGGPGSGGEPGPREGTGESCRLSDGSIGYKDQFGYCNPYPAT